MENINENNGMSIEVINERIENLRNEAITLKRFIESHEVLLSQMREKLSELEKEMTRLVDERMSAQYKGLKEKHPDAVLLFRCGDFYESYFEDAKDIAKILGIVLTYPYEQRNGNGWLPISCLGYVSPQTYPCRQTCGNL